MEHLLKIIKGKNKIIKIVFLICFCSCNNVLDEKSSQEKVSFKIDYIAYAKDRCSVCVGVLSAKISADKTINPDLVSRVSFYGVRDESDWRISKVIKNSIYVSNYIRSEDSPKNDLKDFKNHPGFARVEYKDVMYYAVIDSFTRFVIADICNNSLKIEKVD